MYYHSRVESTELKESKTSWANSKLWISISHDKVLFRCPTASSFVDSNILLSLGLVPLPVVASMAVIPGLWNPLHHGISKVIPTSHSQLLAMAYLGFHEALALLYPRPQWLYLFLDDGCKTPFFYSKARRTTCPKLSSSPACWNWNKVASFS